MAISLALRMRDGLLSSPVSMITFNIASLHNFPGDGNFIENIIFITFENRPLEITISISSAPSIKLYLTSSSLRANGDCPARKCSCSSGNPDT